jgi:putative oxidoreductase
MDRLTRYAPQMLGITRIVTALVFMEHGTQKLFQFPPMSGFGGVGGPGGGGGGPGAGAGGPPAGADGGMPGFMGTLMLIAGILETFGGLAIVLGLLTRPIAFILAGETAVIFWWMHVSMMGGGNIYPVANGGEAAVLYCFTFLYLVFAGPGAFAVDGLLFRRNTAAV